MGLKDRRAWLLVVASEIGEVSNKRVNVIFSAHDGTSPPFWPWPHSWEKPCLFFLRTKGIVLPHPRRKEGMGTVPVVGTDKPLAQVKTY